MKRNRGSWLIGGVLASLLLATGPIQSADDEKPTDAEKAARQKSANNLRQLGIAMHNYNDTIGHLPAAALKDKNGKPLLSWRVALLPYIDEDKLYKEFRLDEPWDSAHNKRLLAKMPKVYAPVMGKTKQPHLTYYQVFTGDGAFGGNVPPVIPRTFVDGTSNTIMITEAGEPVPWTKPVDLNYQDKMAIPRLGGLFKGGFHAMTADCAVSFFKRKKLSEATLRGAITPAGGEVLGNDWDEARRE